MAKRRAYAAAPLAALLAASMAAPAWGSLQVRLIAEVDTEGVSPGDGSFMRKVTYQTYDRDDDVSLHVPARLQANGETYAFSGGTFPVLISTQENEPSVITVETEGFAGDASENPPEETYVDGNGTAYSLTGKELVDERDEPRTQYREVTVEYYMAGAGEEVPETYTALLTDSLTGSETEAELTLMSYEAGPEYWADDFSFELETEDAGASAYRLGDATIPADADLSDYADEFLKYLGLDGGYYRITEISWEEGTEGSPRKAEARGERLVRDVAATYAGEAVFPGLTRHWLCEYTEIIPEEEAYVYTLSSTVTYGRSISAAAGYRSRSEKLKTAAAAAAAFLKRHIPAIAGALALTAGVSAAAAVWKKKRSGKCLYDPGTRCPYGKPDAETCKGCARYRGRQRIKTNYG